MTANLFYKSFTHGEIPLSGRGKALMVSLRNAITKAIERGSYYTDGVRATKSDVAHARGELVQYISQLEANQRQVIWPRYFEWSTGLSGTQLTGVFLDEWSKLGAVAPHQRAIDNTMLKGTGRARFWSPLRDSSSDLPRRAVPPASADTVAATNFNLETGEFDPPPIPSRCDAVNMFGVRCDLPPDHDEPHRGPLPGAYRIGSPPRVAVAGDLYTGVRCLKPYRSIWSRYSVRCTMPYAHNGACGWEL